MKKRLMVLLLLPLSWTACKKDDKSIPRTDLLVNGQWKITHLELTFSLGSQDLLDGMDACTLDNLYAFNADKSITLDEGPTKCNSSAPQSTTDGNWALTDNDSKISVSGSSLTQGFGNISGTITQLDAKTMKVKKDTTFSGVSGAINLTLTNVK